MKESEESGSSPGRVANPPPGSYFAVALAFGLSLCVLTYLHYELFILFIPSLPRKHRYRELGKGGRDGGENPNPENVAKVEYLTSSQ